MSDAQDGGSSSTGAGGEAAALQFDKAELPSLPAVAAEPARAACAACAAALTDVYWDVNGRAACPACKGQIEAQFNGPVGKGPYLRSLAWGAGAALLGSIVWFAVAKLTGYQLGILAIVVGAFVGRAVLKGSRGRGGLGFQIMAVLLTYFSIAGSYVPFVVSAMFDAAAKRHAGDEVSTDSAAVPDSPSSPDEAAADRDQAAGTSVAADAPGKPSLSRFLGLFGLLLVYSFGLALTAPVLGGVMSVIIVGVGLFEAWRVNRRTPISIQGPFRAAGATPEVAPAASAAP